MIQEVFGGGNVSTTTCPKTSSSTITTTAVQSRETLRCPRCESTNTKFCYYNNYNLTQPRHFCKTCRRYWTKGGTLRNVPIGGGCRKNPRTPQTHSSATSSPSSSAPKHKPTFSTQVLLNGFLDHPGPSPTHWPSFPQGQSSHFLSLLRGTTHDHHFPNLNPNPNPSPNPNPLSFTTTLGLDPYGNGAPYPLELNGFRLGGPDIVQNGRNSNNNNNVEDLIYQRLKSSANYGYNYGNEDYTVGSTSSSSAMNSNNGLGAVGDNNNLGGYGVINSAISNSSWSEFPTIPIFGAFP